MHMGSSILTCTSLWHLSLQSSAIGSSLSISHHLNQSFMSYFEVAKYRRTPNSASTRRKLARRPHPCLLPILTRLPVGKRKMHFRPFCLVVMLCCKSEFFSNCVG